EQHFEYLHRLKQLVAKVNYLLSVGEHDEDHSPYWYCIGFHPRWADPKRAEQQQYRRARADQQPIVEAVEQPKTDPIPQRLVLPDAPKPQPKPVAGIFRGIPFQTELEMRCAAEMYGCGIIWDYRRERLSEA